MNTNPLAANYSVQSFALARVRSISRDNRDNPPFSLTDAEWIQFLEETKLPLKGYQLSDYYQVYKAVYLAISTNPDRLSNLSEASGSYGFVDIESTKKSLLKAQAELNESLGIWPSGNVRGGLVASSIVRSW